MDSPWSLCRIAVLEQPVRRITQPNTQLRHKPWRAIIIHVTCSTCPGVLVQGELQRVSLTPSESTDCHMKEESSLPHHWHWQANARDYSLTRCSSASSLWAVDGWGYCSLCWMPLCRCCQLSGWDSSRRLGCLFVLLPLDFVGDLTLISVYIYWGQLATPKHRYSSSVMELLY